MPYFENTVSRRKAIAGIGASTLASSAVLAQPDRRVRLIVPTSAGGATDATARLLQPGLSTALGMTVVVENVPGASGVIGLQTLTRSSPTDITLVVITNSVAILPSTMKPSLSTF